MYFKSIQCYLDEQMYQFFINFFWSIPNLSTLASSLHVNIDFPTEKLNKKIHTTCFQVICEEKHPTFSEYRNNDTPKYYDIPTFGKSVIWTEGWYPMNLK